MKKQTRRAVWHLLSMGFLACLTVTKSAGQDNDSLKLTKESQHFEFYSAPGDVKALDSLAFTLENNYDRITKQLGVQIDKKVGVRVFPNVKAFHDAIKYPGAADWMVGTWNGEELWMVSPLNPGSVHNYASLMQVIVHEFTHLVVYYARGDKGATRMPRWLSEGFSQYEAGQLNEAVRRSAKAGLNQNAPPTWSQLDKASAMEFGNMNGYALSVTIVEFLVDTYGIDKLVSLIKAPENMESIYGLPENELEKQWLQHVTQG